MELTLFSALIVGFLSTLHCLGMCGGIIGALTFSLPTEIRNQRRKLLPYISAYNLGRLVSYTIAGAIAGGLGSSVINIISPSYGHFILQGFAFLIMLSIGLYLAGWFPRFSQVELLGKPVWARIEPLGKKLLPVKSPPYAFLFGLIWGWLPCGLVYSALIWSTSTGGALNGALFMLAFGAGTLPSVMTAGIVSGWIMRLGQRPLFRVGAGFSIIIIAIASLAINLSYTGDESHEEHIHGQQ